MGMMLTIHPEKCTGCRNCELACALEYADEFRIKASRIHVYAWEREAFSVPMMCQQCNDAACSTVCMPKALTRDTATGLIAYDAAKCIGCKMCVQACQFGNVAWDAVSEKILKCDTCGGDPACAKICPTGALEWADDALAVQPRKKSFAAKLKNAFGEAQS